LIFDPRLPATHRGRIADEMALNLDVAPTLLDLAGLDIPKEYQGRSLLPLLRADNVRWRDDFFCEHLFVHPDIPQWEGVRGSRYVYARYFTQQPVYEFLHDLKEDPQELKNLVMEKSSHALLEQMRRRLVELREGYGGEYSQERFPVQSK
jgi:arylsulfatase A-like enzyme